MTTGAAALELIAHLPDVALLDYRMPGMDFRARRVAAVAQLRVANPGAAYFRTTSRRSVYQVPSAVICLGGSDSAPEIVKAVLDAKGRDVVAPRWSGPCQAASARAPRPRCSGVRERERFCSLRRSKHPRDRSRYVAPSDGKDPRATPVRELGVMTELPRSPGDAQRLDQPAAALTACTDRASAAHENFRTGSGCWCQLMLVG